MSSLPCCLFTFKGSAAFLVCLGPSDAISNHSSLSMSVLPLTMLFIRAISALCLLSSRVVRPSSLSFSIYMSQILVLRLPGPLVSGLPLEALFLLGSSVTMRGPQIPGEVKHIAYTAPERPHRPYNGTTVRSDQGLPVPSWLPWCFLVVK